VMLRVIDEKWKDHLYDLDQLRNAITYRAWGQKDPLIEYKKDAYDMFVDLVADLRATFAEQFLARVQVTTAPPPPVAMPLPRTFTGPAAPEGEAVPLVRREVAGGLVAPEAAVQPRRPPGPPLAALGAIGPSESQKSATLRAAGIGGPPRAPAGASAGPGGYARVGRNDPCPCGSGKKYKKCHGAGG